MRDTLREGDYILYKNVRYKIGSPINRTYLGECLFCDIGNIDCIDVQKKYGLCNNILMRRGIGSIKAGTIVEVLDNVFVISVSTNETCKGCASILNTDMGCEDWIVGTCGHKTTRKIININRR